MAVRVRHFLLCVTAAVGLCTAVYFVAGRDRPFRLSLDTRLQALDKKWSAMVGREHVENNPPYSEVDCSPDTPCLYPEVESFNLTLCRFKNA